MPSFIRLLHTQLLSPFLARRISGRNSVLCDWHDITILLTMAVLILRGGRCEGSNTGKRTRQKNLRHPRERFLVSNEALSSWRPIEIFPAGVCDFSVFPSYQCLILFLTNSTK